MSERIRNLVYVVALVVMAAGLVILVATNPTDVDRVQAIGEQIKCPVCQGESIANSPAQMARDMMDLVAEKVADGQSDGAIIDDLLASYSGAVLLDPPARGATLVLWLAPLIALGLGVSVIVWWRSHPKVTSTGADAADRSEPRRLAPLLVLGAAFAGTVVVAGFFLQDRSGPASGVAAIGEDDLENVSNETMEAVIAANTDNPEIDGMRLALAERYFETGDYRLAFPHYLEVAESPDAADVQVVTALVRLGWMAWQGNDEVDAAIGLFDQALAVDPASTTAMYLKGQVLWCGAGDNDNAATLFEEVLSDPALGDESRDLVSADLEAVRSGGTCT